MDANTDDETTVVQATIPVEKVVFALKMNATNGADDRTIAVPQRSNADAYIRRKFRGSERYSNPASAPIHIRPEALVDDGWERPPTRGEIDVTLLDVPTERRNRDEDDEAAIDEAHDVLVDNWERDVERMIAQEHEFGPVKDCTITLVGVEGDE